MTSPRVENALRNAERTTLNRLGPDEQEFLREWRTVREFAERFGFTGHPLGKHIETARRILYEAWRCGALEVRGAGSDGTSEERPLHFRLSRP